MTSHRPRARLYLALLAATGSCGLPVANQTDSAIGTATRARTREETTANTPQIVQQTNVVVSPGILPPATQPYITTSQPDHSTTAGVR